MKQAGLIFCCLFLLGVSCKKKDDTMALPMTMEYGFESGDEGWIVGFSDYPVGLSLSDSLVLYQLSYGWSKLPASVTPAQSGIRISGINRSDDLFMYIKRKITGLLPDTEYKMDFEVDLASNAPTNAIGIGGPPGEAVVLKVGASPKEPLNVRDALQHYRLNIDKGNQSVGGADMAVIGHVGVADTTTVHAIIRRRTTTSIVKRSSANGELWLITGTDSGFEGKTELWWARVKVVLQP